MRRTSALRITQKRSVDGHRVAVMPNAAQQDIDHRFIAEEAMPLVIDQVGSDNRGVAMITLLHQFEEGVRLFGL